MKIPKLQHSKGLILLLVGFLMVAIACFASEPQQNDGKLIVIVTWGDVDNTPATDVIVEAVGQTPDHSWGKKVLLKASKKGQYEASLDAGIYDVFVSESGSMPRCRRLSVTSKSSMYWTLKLEDDDVYHRGDVF